MPPRSQSPFRRFARRHWLDYRRSMRRGWRRGRKNPLCYTCGYNLRGNLGDAACPECGRAIEWRPNWLRDGRYGWRNVTLVTCGVMFIFTLVMYTALISWPRILIAQSPPVPEELAIVGIYAGKLGTMATIAFGFWLVTSRTRSQENGLKRLLAFLGVVLMWGLILMLVAELIIAVL